MDIVFEPPPKINYQVYMFVLFCLLSYSRGKSGFQLEPRTTSSALATLNLIGLATRLDSL
jgi:hypothetical protein